MVFARCVLSAVFAAGVLPFAADQAAADHIGRALPAFEPAGLIFAVTSVDEMNPQMRKAYIRGIQEELAAHRYDPGPADGILGPRTRMAIRTYQRDAALPVTGVASKELLDHLKFVQPKVFAAPEREPDVTVLEVQTRLQVRGYYRGELDGLMGGATRESIRAYRQDAGLPVGSVIDRPLLESLRPAQTQEAVGILVPEPAENPAGTQSEVQSEDQSEARSETWSEPTPADELPIVTPLPPTPPPMTE